MEGKKHKPFVPADQEVSEFTFRAVFLGIILAIILGAANAYLGLKAGMTVAAVFPAAVISMAVLRIFNGTILEENISRTTGAVGEALAAGAVFTIPAFVITGVWDDFHYGQATLLMLVGGLLGVLFVIILRRTFMDDYSLPFPESQACAQIVKAGQKGSSGAGLVFGFLGLAGAIEFFKNVNGIQLIGEKVKAMFHITDHSQIPFQSPVSSPAFLGVGFIIGPFLAAVTFSGGVFGWLFLMPLVIYLKGGIVSLAGGATDLASQFGAAKGLYSETVKIMAVGGMIVGAFNTLYNMRKSLWDGIRRSVGNITGAKAGGDEIRTEKDLNFRYVFIAIGVLFIPMLVIYYKYTQSVGVALLTMVVMAAAGFLFAAVAGYLVSIIGSSSNPISGLTLSTLLIAAGLLLILGMKGDPGIMAVLAVATVVCCIAGVAGDMIQDWKVGHILGGTPWRMELGGLIGVTAAALILVIPIMILHKGGGGIGSDALPAPQAGLMATMAQGIIGGQMEWGLILAGMLFSVGLIMIKSPSPMLICVGMYLPFETTAAIFLGGVIKHILDRQVEKSGADDDKKSLVENRGLLVASGLVAGEALIGVILAGVVAAKVKFFCDGTEEGLTCLASRPEWFAQPILGFLTIIALGALMVYFPYKAITSNK